MSSGTAVRKRTTCIAALGWSTWTRGGLDSPLRRIRLLQRDISWQLARLATAELTTICTGSLCICQSRKNARACFLQCISLAAVLYYKKSQNTCMTLARPQSVYNAAEQHRIDVAALRFCRGFSEGRHIPSMPQLGAVEDVDGPQPRTGNYGNNRILNPNPPPPTHSSLR